MPLIVAATPIGNAGDASTRLREALAAADVIAAEDTRRVRRLLGALEVTTHARLVSYHDHNEAQRSPALLDDIRGGRRVLLVTDAGTPLVSDPGYRLVAAVAAEGLPIQSLPGPSAALAALTVAGLPAERWCFEGFLPRKPGDRRRTLAALAAERRTLVLFEAPHRLAATLLALAEQFGGGRPGVVCRELTKTHEEVVRGTLDELAAWAGDREVLGEVTLVVAGAPEAPVADDRTLAAAVRDRVAAGASRRDAAAAVAASYGVSRRRVYDLAHD